MQPDISVLWGYYRGNGDALLDMTDRGCRHLLSFRGVGGLSTVGEKIWRVPDATKQEVVARYLALRSAQAEPVNLRALAVEFRLAYCTVVRITRPVREREVAA